MIEIIKNIVHDIEEDVIKTRRDFHKYPELAYREFRTASLIAGKLKDIGCEIKIGKEIMDAKSREALPSNDILQKELERASNQGGDKEFLEQVKNGFPAIAAIISNGNGPTIAIRVDIDALPIQESSNEKHLPFKEGFASENTGVMHACGHDANAATGLGIAQVLMQLKDKINGTVKIIFQPAEEAICGARPMAESGFLDDVDRIYSLHYFSPWPSGDVTCVRGKGYLAISKFDVKFKGEAAHAGSQPEAGKNALLAAASAVMNLNSIPRNSEGGTRINVGTLKAGTARNAVCDEAFMEIETRGETTELNEYMREHAMRILKNSAETWSCDLEITPMGSAPGGSSDDDFADIVMAFAEKTKILNARHEQRSCGSEDFNCMLERVRQCGGKGAAITIGAAPGGKHHSPDFDLDENAIIKTIAFASGLILEIMNNY